jgi:hypothetical protein
VGERDPQHPDECQHDDDVRRGWHLGRVEAPVRMARFGARGGRR